MTTPTGTIGLSDVNIVLGLAPNANIQMQNDRVRALAGGSMATYWNTIDMNSLRGKSSWIAPTAYADPIEYTEPFYGSAGTGNRFQSCSLSIFNGSGNFSTSWSIVTGSGWGIDSQSTNSCRVYRSFTRFGGEFYGTLRATITDNTNGYQFFIDISIYFNVYDGNTV